MTTKLAQPGDISDKLAAAIDEISFHIAKFAETAATAVAAGEQATKTARTYSELLRGLDDDQYRDMWTIASNAAVVGAAVASAYAITNFAITAEEFDEHVNVTKEQFAHNLRTIYQRLKAEEAQRRLEELEEDKQRAIVEAEKADKH